MRVLNTAGKARMSIDFTVCGVSGENLLAVWASGTEEPRFRAFMLYYEAALIYPQCIGTEPNTVVFESVIYQI